MELLCFKKLRRKASYSDAKGKLLIPMFLQCGRYYNPNGVNITYQYSTSGYNILTLYYSAKEKAQMFRDDLVSKSFYRFRYHTKVCDGQATINDSERMNHKQ